MDSLKALLSRCQRGLYDDKSLDALERIAAIAPLTTPEEAARLAPFSTLSELNGSCQNLNEPMGRAVAAWMASGVIWHEPEERATYAIFNRHLGCSDDLAKLGSALSSPPTVAQLFGGDLGNHAAQRVASVKGLSEKEELALIAEMAKQGLAHLWLGACLISARSEPLAIAMRAGLRFDSDQKRANEIFREFLNARLDERSWGCGSPKTVKEKALERSETERVGEIKRQRWELASQAGFPLIGDDKPLVRDPRYPPYRAFIVHFHEAALWALKAEANRGGALDVSSCWLWNTAGLYAGGPSDALWDGNGAIAWAGERGLPLKQWPAEVLRERKANYRPLVGNVALDANLAALAKSGRVFSREEILAPAESSFASDTDSVMQALLASEISPKGILTAASMGVDPLAPAPSGMGSLQRLFNLGATGLAGRARALLEAADLAESEGAKKMMTELAKDKSGPLHWAASALCPEAIELFAARGADVHAKDASGKTPGHWAARRYGAKNQKKVGPTLEALTNAGFDWSTLDKKGVSALAALASKGPIEPLAAIVAKTPEALEAGSSSSKKASTRLAERGGAALSAVESAALGGSIEEPKSKPEPKKSRL